MKILQTSLVLTALFFGVFFFNVVLGAFFKTSFLSDVGEALLLFVSVILFVVAILVSEKFATSD
jgi:uncharacterized membrane protein HdeD (DUF308 family)